MINIKISPNDAASPISFKSQTNLTVNLLQVLLRYPNSPSPLAALHYNMKQLQFKGNRRAAPKLDGKHSRQVWSARCVWESLRPFALDFRQFSIYLHHCLLSSDVKVLLLLTKLTLTCVVVLQLMYVLPKSALTHFFSCCK